MTQNYHKFVNGVTLGTLILAPIMIVLPPRRLNFFTFVWGVSFAAAAVHRDIPAKMYRPIQNLSMPRGARELQERRELERQNALVLERRRLLEERQPGAVAFALSEAERNKQQKGPGALLEEKAKEIWMGGETEGWKERRLREEQEKLAQGETYGSMIADQIWEVWNWREKKSEGAEGQGQGQGRSSSKES